MTTETKMREAFEKAAVSEGLNIALHRNAHDDYDCENTQWRWLGFKHGLLAATLTTEARYAELVEASKDMLFYVMPRKPSGRNHAFVVSRMQDALAKLEKGEQA